MSIGPSPGYLEMTFKVIDIQEDKAVISTLKSDGTWDKEIIVPKG